jgi:hypothetical protein
VLVVSKTTRLERIISKGIQILPKIAEYSKEDWLAQSIIHNSYRQEANDRHYSVVECICDQIKKAGIEVEVKKRLILIQLML